MGWESNFKTFTRLLMHVAIHYRLCSKCIQKREAHQLGKKKERKKKKIERCGSELVVCPGVFWMFCYFCKYIYVFIEGTTKMLCDHLNPMSWKCGLTYFISIDMEMCTYSVICYTYCYIFDMLFLTTGLPMWKCSYFIHYIITCPSWRLLTYCSAWCHCRSLNLW